MKCKLTIFSMGKGWSNKVSDNAQMEVDENGVTIFYKIENDDCILTITDKFAEQERHGKLNIKLKFALNQTTECVIGEGGMQGGYEIFTTKYQCKIGKYGCSLDMSYLAGAEKERTDMTIRTMSIK